MSQFLCDFHIHSTFSDGKLSIPELVDLYGKAGFGAIAITDHLCEKRSFLGWGAQIIDRTLCPANWGLYREVLRSEAERAWRQYKMVLLGGFEYTKNSVSNFRSAHLLGIFESELPADFRFTNWESPDIRNVAEGIKSVAGLTVAAHPVSTRKVEKQTFHLWDRREELRGVLDAWEVASGPYLFDEVSKAKLPVIASSDLHRPEQITSYKTRLEGERSPGAILQKIRAQKLEVVFWEAS